MDQHNAALSLITAQIKSFHATQTPYRISHGSTNSTRPKPSSSSSSPTAFLDTSPLSNILSISPLTLTTIVESNVSMESLVAATLPYSLIPAIVPEFPGITVGGAYSGTAAESSSFRYGYFDRVVNWVEMVVADGKVVRAEREGENRDLFNGAAGALGTLGVVTLLEVRLVKVTKYVEVEYVPVLGVQEMLREVGERGKEEGVCFLDAVLFSKVSGVVVLGRCQQEEEEESTSLSTTKTKAKKSKTGQEEKSNLPIVHFSRAKDPWFCLHAHGKVTHPCNTHCIICKWTHTLPDHLNIGNKEKEMKELVPVKDFLFRYDRGAFWMGCYGWENAGLPFNRFMRWLLDRVFRTRMLYRIMHNFPNPPSFIIQDLAIPTEHAAAFLTFNDDELKIYPIWLCPIRSDSPALLHTAKSYIPPSLSPTSIPSTSNPLSPDPQSPPSPPSSSSNPPTITNTITNIGLWGLPHLGLVPFTSHNYHYFLTLNRTIEAKVQELKGLKWLYAHNYFSEGQFWENYDKDGYERLRRKWGAEGGLSLWDKVGRKGGEGKGEGAGNGGNEEEGVEEEGVEVVGLMGLVRAVWGVLVVGNGKKGKGKKDGESERG